MPEKERDIQELEAELTTVVDCWVAERMGAEAQAERTDYLIRENGELRELLLLTAEFISDRGLREECQEFVKQKNKEKLDGH